MTEALAPVKSPEGLSLEEAEKLKEPVGNVNPNVEKHLKDLSPEASGAAEAEQEEFFPGEETLKKLSKSKGIFYNFAPIVHSRESTYRAVLDIVAYDLPNILAGATRGLANFIERVYENVVTTSLYALSPYMFDGVSKLLAPKIFSPDELDDRKFYLLFSRTELDDEESFQKGIERIRNEEARDKLQLARLYELNNRESQVERYKKEAQEIRDFCDKVEYSKELCEKIKTIKKQMTQVESFIEGLGYASLGPTVKLIRKLLFKMDRFSGTEKYLNDEEAKQVDAEKGTSLVQKLGTALSLVIGPGLNTIWFNISDSPKKVGKSKFRKAIRENIGFTHGMFAKLWTLISMVTIPKWTGMLAAAQKFELVERVINFATGIPSFMFGDRVSNGTLAKKADKYLVEKYGVEPGILVRKEHLEQRFPEPAKYEYVYERLRRENNPELVKEADELYRSTLYKGFGWHAGAVFLIIMANQLLTKIRVKWEVSRAKKLEKAKSNV